MLLLNRSSLARIWTPSVRSFAQASAGAGADAGADNGYFFLGPKRVKRTKAFKNGFTLVAYHQHGVSVAQCPGGPWCRGAFFAQGSTLLDAEGRPVSEVALCEITDPHGDLTWGLLEGPDQGPGTFTLKAGTGKWKGISGRGRLLEPGQKRSDDYTMPGWEIQWRRGPEDDGREDAVPMEEAYPHHDRGLSFHGPHVEDFSRQLDNGVTLIVSSQSGMLLSENPEAESPRNYATCYDRGTTIQAPDGNGDVMLLEDTDPDGDIVWLFHQWWYGTGPGTYEFIAGTGKWRGIAGVGRTLDMVRPRTDDHYMLRSEMHWRIDETTGGL